MVLAMRRLLVLAGLGTLAAVLWLRKNPSACPYSQRLFVELPHPGITRRRLIEVLEPRPGERVLEIGPGTGYYTFEMAGRLDGGHVDVFDIQQEMLDHVMREAERRGVANVQPALGDAQELPYGDDSFDAVVLITVLGEIPDQDRALSEIARVLKPGGRLVVGEMFFDPHVVPSGKLRERAGRAGLSFARRVGGPLAFFARLEKPPAATPAAHSNA
jgi:ubiquinone/menaquinone biosynthesis C-methylase UbiE